MSIKSAETADVKVEDSAAPVPAKRKRKSGWGAVGESGSSAAALNTGFSGPVNNSSLPLIPALLMNTPLPVNPMDAALSSSRLHMLTQQLGLPDEIVRQTRELDVNNLPPSIDAASLSDFLSAALIALKGNAIAGSPVLCSHFSIDGNYATVELRTMEEANNCMMLNGIDCYGYRLQISRTKAYPEVLSQLGVARRITMPSTSQVVNGMLTGVPLNVSAPCEVLGTAFNENISRMGAIVCAYPNTIVKTQSNVMILRNFPTPDILPQTKIVEFLTTLGSLKFAIHFGLPPLVAVRRVLSQNITKKNRMKEEMDLPDCAMSEIMKLSAEEGVCIFEYHSPVDTMRLEELVGNGEVKLAGRELTLMRDGDKAVAEDEILMLMTHHVIRELVKEHIPHQPDECLVIPTRVLYFANIACIEEVSSSDELYREVYDDIRIQCRITGRVIDMLLVRPEGRNIDVSQMPQSNNPNPIFALLDSLDSGGGTGGLSGGYEADDRKPPTETLDHESLLGWCFVEFATVEDACRTRKELHRQKFSGRPAEVHFLDERIWADRRLERELMQPNRERQGSTAYNPSLGAHIPQKLLELEELEKQEKDHQRAAATAAANAMFSGNSVLLNKAEEALALTDERSKIDFDADVIKDEEEMDLEE